jgi:hypothetical protein
MDKTPTQADLDEQYAGPGPVVTALGYAKKYDIVGLAVGGVVGAAAATPITKHVPWVLEKAIAWKKIVPFVGSEKTLVRLGGIIGGSFVLHYAGLIYGFAVKGWPHRHEGIDQFARIKQERNEALAKVATLESTIDKASAELTAKPEYAQQYAASRTEHDGHAAAVEAQKHAAETDIAR